MFPTDDETEWLEQFVMEETKEKLLFLLLELLDDMVCTVVYFLIIKGKQI